MSKLFLATAIATTLIGWAEVARTQVLPLQYSSQNYSVPAKITSPQLALSAAPDLTLLSKASGVFWQTDRAETQSQMTIRVANTGVDMKVYAQIKTIAQIGNKFSTQLTFALPGSSSKITYLLISNGRKVWIYRPDRRQYSEISLTQFQSGNNSFWIGTPSFMFLTITETNRKQMLSSLGTDRDFIRSISPTKIGEISGSDRQIDDRNLFVYSFNYVPNQVKFNLFLDPTTAITQQMEFTGIYKGLNVTFSEKIFSRDSQIKTNQKTFVFVPPKGAKKVKNLPIDPFGSLAN